VRLVCIFSRIVRHVDCGKLELVGMSKTIETFQPPSADDPVLSEVVRRLSEVYHPLRIYLFGSAARGDAGPDSDYDIMVVVPDDAPRGEQDCEIGYRAWWGPRGEWAPRRTS